MDVKLPFDLPHMVSLSACCCLNRAKRIVNHAVVNEDPNARIIRELRAEVKKVHRTENEVRTDK
jgi:hypothetical protein